MMNGDELLWDVLPHPRGSDLVPAARSSAWNSCRLTLQSLEVDGQRSGRVRTPAVLWSMLHGSAMPPGTTWQALLGQQTVSDLVRAERQPRPSWGAGYVSWNVHYLRDTQTQQNQDNGDIK